MNLLRHLTDRSPKFRRNQKVNDLTQFSTPSLLCDRLFRNTAIYLKSNNNCKVPVIVHVFSQIWYNNTIQYNTNESYIAPQFIREVAITNRTAHSRLVIGFN